MNDEPERWVDPEGPEPDEILDAASYERTPEEEERVERRIFAAVAADRRRRARRRTLSRGLFGGLLAAGLVAGLALALRRAGPFDLSLARRLLPDASMAMSTHLGSALRPWPEPAVSASARPPEAEQVPAQKLPPERR